MQCSWRGLSWWFLTMVCVGHCGQALDYSAANVSYEMPYGLTQMGGMVPSTLEPALSSAPGVALEDCCKGTLGYASGNHILPYPCAKSRCCDERDAVAVIPVDIALGFKFVCMPRSSVRTLCYQAGSEVCTSNQDPDHVPRTCCPGSRFHVLLNRWYAAMIIKCIEEGEEEDEHYYR
ncbi:hypothetical protein BaRGS_00038603 [Batillaria attramentaria]|uniref:Uncharacterized protein n=1 Tax=Batillaria attramentaria TaxID=370345 RepID=A0ABD0J5F3_9CAEN